MEKLKISVITPSFNSADYIERAIQSVLDQNYENFEHIIMDNCSTDGTLEILQKYPHLIWKSEKDSGQSNAMNKGFELSTGDIIVYLNCDDYFLPDAFHSVIPYFEKGEKFIVGDLIMIDLKGQKHHVSPQIEHFEILKHWKDRAFPNNPVQYFYLKEVQEQIPFNEKNHMTMDLEFLMAASAKYSFKKINFTLGVYPLLADAKSIKASSDIYHYWTFENFKYIDKFLLNLDKNEILTFKQEQQKAYLYNVLNIVNKKEAKEQINNPIINKLHDLTQIKLTRNPFKKIKIYKELLQEYHKVYK